MAARLRVALASLRNRSANAQEVQLFSGIASVIFRSGESQRWTRFRWACPKFLRQTF